MKNKAFTLAEVLITLVIIGVIAAMTIPTLMGSTNDQEMKNKFKKAYAAINNAFAMDYALYGNKVMSNWQIAPTDKVRTMLKNHLSIVEEWDDGTLITADGAQIGVWNVDGQGMGMHIWFRKNGSWDWRCAAPDDDGGCTTIEECKNFHPNVFPMYVFCDDKPDRTKMCIANRDAVAYSYIYDTTIEDGFAHFGL